MTSNNNKRREVAERLRELAGGYVTIGDFQRAIGFSTSTEIDIDRDAKELRCLADLIDPICEACRDTVFKPAVLYPDTESDDVGREETVYRCSGCGEIVSYDEGYDPETDLPAYCERCGSRITGIGEPLDE